MTQAKMRAADAVIDRCCTSAIEDLSALIAHAVRASDDARVTDLDRVLRTVEQIRASQGSPLERQAR